MTIFCLLNLIFQIILLPLSFHLKHSINDSANLNGVSETPVCLAILSTIFKGWQFLPTLDSSIWPPSSCLVNPYQIYRRFELWIGIKFPFWKLVIGIPIVKIGPDFQSLIPYLTKDEKDALEKSLVEEGCRDELIAWDDLLPDGHNRYGICTRLDIPYKVHGKTFDNRDQAKAWIINNQLSRRNLIPMQSSKLRGIWYDGLDKKEVGEHESNQHLEIGKNCHIPTAVMIAKATGVSERTVCNDAKFAETLATMPPDIRAKVLSGKLKWPRPKSLNGRKWRKQNERRYWRGNPKRKNRKSLKGIKCVSRKELGGRIAWTFFPYGEYHPRIHTSKFLWSFYGGWVKIVLDGWWGCIFRRPEGLAGKILWGVDNF